MTTLRGGFAASRSASSTRCLYGTALPPRMPASDGDHHLGRRVVDARGEARRRESAEDHRMDRADARAGEHREHRFGNHRHVDQHAIAAADALRLEHRRAAVDLGGELAVRVALRLAGLGGDVDRAPAARRARRDGGRRRCGTGWSARRRTIWRTAAASSRAPTSNGVCQSTSAASLAPECVAVGRATGGGIRCT